MIDIFDPLHGSIEIDPTAKRIIDTPEFQRLRNIKQLGCCYYVFPGACHNRFEHSLGVYHLAKEYMKELGIDNFTEKEQQLISIGGLIHDIGHGPFSHLFDELTNSKHEDRSIQLFIHMNKEYGLGYSEEDIRCLGDIIDPKDSKTKEKPYIYQIVSNKNGIDVDRFDYIMRDTKMIGLNYGIEWRRIMKGSKLQNNQIIYSDKVKIPIEDFFRTRYILYKEIYHHRAVRSIEHMIKDILHSVDDIFQITKCIHTQDWKRFITLNDSVIDAIALLKLDNAIVDRIKKRQLYTLTQSYVFQTRSELEEWKEHNITDSIVDESVITYYESEVPVYFMGRFTVSPNLIERDNKLEKEYHLKVYER